MIGKKKSEDQKNAFLKGKNRKKTIHSIKIRKKRTFSMVNNFDHYLKIPIFSQKKIICHIGSTFCYLMLMYFSYNHQNYYSVC